MKILVTGGAGFIGTHLVRALLARGDSVHVVDNFSTGIKNTLPSDSRLEVEEADISKRQWKAVEISSFDQIYHLAAVVGVKRVLERPLETIQTNMEGTANLLAGINRTTKKPRLFLASTSEVYGKNESHTLSESSDRITGSTLKERWIYAETKAMDEFLVNLHHKKFGLRSTIARFFSIVGPGQVSDYGMVLPNFVEKAIENKPIEVYGDGSQVRSFMDVRDCVFCVMKSMDIKNGGVVVNIGNSDPIMIKDLAYRVKTIANSKSEIRFIPYDKAYGDGFEEIYHRVPDISLLRTIIGSATHFRSVDEIIADTIRYYAMKEVLHTMPAKPKRKK